MNVRSAWSYGEDDPNSYGWTVLWLDGPMGGRFYGLDDAMGWMGPMGWTVL